MGPNRMMYRVFLQDGNSDKGAHFRISSGCMNAWTHTNPNWQPTIDEQLKAIACISIVGSTLEEIDGHFTIGYDGSVIGIVHSPEEIPDKAYSLAKEKAIEITNNLRIMTENPYLFVDVTSRGDRRRAEILAAVVVNEPIVNHTYRPLA